MYIVPTTTLPQAEDSTECTPSQDRSMTTRSRSRRSLHSISQRTSPHHIIITHPNQTTDPTPFQPDPFTLFAACLFHDIGTCASHNGPQRFEVEGADAAITYLKSAPISVIADDPSALHAVWTAIALHTSAGIAERIDPFTAPVRNAVKADFSLAVRERLGLGDFAVEVETWVPRLGVEACLAAAVVGQATRGEVQGGLYVDGEGRKWADSAKFPKGSWPGVLLRGHLERVRDEGEGWKGENPAF